MASSKSSLAQLDDVPVNGLHPHWVWGPLGAGDGWGDRATAHIQNIWIGGFPDCVADRYKIRGSVGVGLIVDGQRRGRIALIGLLRVASRCPNGVDQVGILAAKPAVVWFALNDDRPLFAFAGIWTTFNGDRGTKSKPVPRPLTMPVVEGKADFPVAHSDF